jgi:hypothetical protein
MRPSLRPLLAVAGASGILLVPSAAAKSGLFVTIEPARPTARADTRVVIRSDVDPPTAHGIRLYAVGPWRRNLGQAFFEIRLTRVAPRTLTGRVRFPYPGRWQLSIPPPAASPALAMPVTVRPRG